MNLPLLAPPIGLPLESRGGYLVALQKMKHVLFHQLVRETHIVPTCSH